MGIISDDDDDVELWPENILPFELLTLVQWQWLNGMTIARIGPDHGSLWQLIEHHPDSPMDPQSRWELFQMVLAAGAACCEVWNAQ